MGISEETCLGTAQSQCSGGQVWRDCGSACDSTCEEPNPMCTEQCVSRCQCPPNKPIWHQGECVVEKTCQGVVESQCSGGQVWHDCGSACDGTCDQPSPMCTMECVARCQCPADKPIWHGGECIAEKSCHGVTEAESSVDMWNLIGCSGGQVWHDCGSACNSTCEMPNPMCATECVARCQCPGHLPIWHQGECISEETCPGTAQSQCSGGQVWRDCGSACDSTCEEPNPMCTEQCVARCQCPPNKPIWHQGECVAEKTCQGVVESQCIGGQVWHDCGSACDGTCDQPSPMCTMDAWRGVSARDTSRFGMQMNALRKRCARPT